MKSKTRFTRTKKIIAWLLVICMVMTNISPITSIHVHAEGEGNSSSTDVSTIACTIKATISVDGTVYPIPPTYVSITNVSPENGTYQLRPETEYQYVIKGAEIKETTGTIKVSKADAPSKEIGISVPVDNLQIAYDGDVTKMKVGDVRNVISELKIPGKWTVSSQGNISIDENTGKIKALKSGSVTVTRKSETTQTNPTPHATVCPINVVEDYSLKYSLNGKEIGFIEDVKVKIKDNGVEVSAKEDSKYELICGKNYTYSIESATGLQATTDQSFTVPEGTEVVLPIKLALPKFELEGKELSSNLVVKKDAQNIPISCINATALFDASNWKIKNGTKEFAVSASDIKINAADKIQITYNGVVVEEYNLLQNTDFGPYVINYEMNGTSINQTENQKNAIRYTSDKKLEDLEPGQEYELTKFEANGFEYGKTENGNIKINTKYTVKSQTVDLKEYVTLTSPTILKDGTTSIEPEKIYEVPYGTTIKVNVQNWNQLLNTGANGWTWNWDKEPEGINEPIAANDQHSYECELKGNVGDVYTLTYKFGDMASSNSLKFKITKIKVYMDKLPSGEKYYDANEEFEVSKAANSDCFYTKQGDNKIAISEANDTIKIIYDVTGSDVGLYDKGTIKSIEAYNSAINKVDYYDFSEIKTKDIDNGGSIIKKAIVDFSIKNLCIYYHSLDYNVIKSELKEENESGQKLYNNIDDSLKKQIFSKLKKITVTNETDRTYSIDLPVSPIQDNNIEWKIISTPEKFEFSSEILDYTKNMQNEIKFKQQQLGDEEKEEITGDKKWINKNSIEAKFVSQANIDEGGNPTYHNDYKQLRFQKTDLDNNGKVIMDQSGELNDDLSWGNSETIDNDQYYKLILSKNNMYNTTALIIRIIAENNANKEYDDTIKGSDGTTYRVVNLIMDDTKDTISLSFDKNDKVTITGISNQSDEGWNEYPYDEYPKPCGTNLYLNIKNTSTDIVEGYYKIIDAEKNIVDSNILKSAKWDDNEVKTLSDVIPLDVEEGRYIVLVKVVDGVGNTSLFATNPIVLDNTPPEINATLGGTALDSADQSMIVNQSQELVITVKETNIKEVTATVKAVNAEGNNVEKIELSKDNMENALKNGTSPYTYKCNVTTDANYTVELTVTDQVGNKNSVTYHFTKDATAPNEGKIEIAGFMSEITSKDGGVIKTAAKNIAQVWNGIVEKIYDIFLQGSAEVTMSAKDETTDVEISYIMADQVYSESELAQLSEDTWTKYDSSNKPKTQTDQREFIYMRAKDKAGNASYFNSKGIITDTVAPEISYTLDREANKNGFYNNNVTIQAEVKDATGSLQNGSSGLQYVGYRIEADGKKLKAEALIDAVTAETSKNFKIVLDAKTYNTNDLKVYITAVDNAGNKKDLEAEPIELKIDNVAPQISVTFDDQDGAEYYNHTRTATVTIKERNLKTSDIDLQITSKHGKKATIGKWSHTDNIEKSDDATYTCKVKFDQDDDYTFYVDCVDKAGNKAKTSKKYKFTIDKTVPTIEVSYNNAQVTENSYFNQEITATITIKEHNFDANQATVQVGAQNAAAPSTTAFNGQGDTHTANVTFNKDGVYQLQVAFKDKAGNEADSYRGNSFTIDLTNPEIQITNVEDKSANKDEVNPVVVCKDENYDNKNVTITVTGANSGEIELNQLGLSRRPTGDGEEFSLNFPKQEDMDDVYTLTAKMEDMAGNGTEQTVQFSVNRYGSVYTLGTESGEWLENGICSYVKEAKQVVIVETNVDEVVDHNISYTTGAISAEAVTVKDQTECSGEEQQNGTYYETQDLSDGNGWYQYQYTIEPGNFSKEGNYSIQIDSTDRAGNHTSNVSNKHKDSNLEILFAVDQTAPSAVVTGTENGGIYKEDEHTVLLDVQDNIALKDVTIYLNGNQYATYDANQIAELDDGLIPVNVTESISSQTIQLVATDMAGNILGEKPEGEFDKTFEDFNLLVTQNVLVQILHAYWVVMILGAVAIGAGTTGVLLIRRRKK